jgi:son of sevenless-like protein
VFLTTLTFIQDGAEDNLSANVVNFRKRQKASEVIRDIKRWQSPPYNFQPVPSIQTYLDDAFKNFTSSVELGDFFWNLSLQREPREREDEKMARLLQESGFVSVMLCTPKSLLMCFILSTAVIPTEEELGYP